MTGLKFKIVCFSTSEWDNIQWTNRQNIMSRLSRHHDVLYINPGIQSKMYYKSKLSKSPITFLLKWNCRINENLKVFNPVFLFLYRGNRLLRWLSWKVINTYIKRKLKLNKLPVIFWYYSPEAFIQSANLRANLRVYDCVDFYEESPYYSNNFRRKEAFLLNEKTTIREADLTIFTSEVLLKEKGIESKKCFLAENVADVDRFQGVASFRKYEGGKIKVIYVGAINTHKLDAELLKSLDQRDDLEVRLIGPVGEWGSSLLHATEYKRLIFEGALPHAELPQLIQEANVCIIPYNVNSYTRGVFPLKLFEYLASGKPVISTDLPSLEKYHNIIHYTGSRKAFIDAIYDAAINDSYEKFLHRIDESTGHSWEHKVAKIEVAIKEIYSEDINQRAAHGL